MTGGTYFTDVLLGDNPTERGVWSQYTGQTYDIWGVDPPIFGNWYLSVNRSRIGPATVGWIYRNDGSWGHLAGLMVVYDTPEQEFSEDVQIESGRSRTLYYRSGMVWGLPREWWIDGARIHQTWPDNRAPFGEKIRHFQNGEHLEDKHVAVLEGLLHPVALLWLDFQRAMVEDLAIPEARQEQLVLQ